MTSHHTEDIDSSERMETTRERTVELADRVSILPNEQIPLPLQSDISLTPYIPLTPPSVLNPANVTFEGPPRFHPYSTVKPRQTALHPQNLNTKIWTTIRERGEADQVDTTYFTQRHHPFISYLGGERKASIWERVLDGSMFVSDEELGLIFKLKESKKASKIEPGIQYMFYIRSFELRINQLRHLIARLESSGKHYAECLEWHYQLESNPSRTEDSKVWIRYVGLTSGGTPYERNRKDLKRQCGIFGAFMEDIVRMFPDVYQKLRIWEITEAAMGKWRDREGMLVDRSTNELLKDARERIIIALFKKSILLNRQTGGTYASFVADGKDALVYTTLRITLLRKMQQSRANGQIGPHSSATKKDDRQMFSLIANWAKMVHRFGAENSTSTLYGDFPWSDEYENLIAEQAHQVDSYMNVANVVEFSHVFFRTNGKP